MERVPRSRALVGVLACKVRSRSFDVPVQNGWVHLGTMLQVACCAFTCFYPSWSTFGFAVSKLLVVLT